MSNELLAWNGIFLALQVTRRVALLLVLALVGLAKNRTSVVCLPTFPSWWCSCKEQDKRGMSSYISIMVMLTLRRVMRYCASCVQSWAPKCLQGCVRCHLDPATCYPYFKLAFFTPQPGRTGCALANISFLLIPIPHFKLTSCCLQSLLLLAVFVPDCLRGGTGWLVHACAACACRQAEPLDRKVRLMCLS